MKQFGLLLVTGNQTHQENYARAFAADPRCRLVGLTDEAIGPRRTELNRKLAQELEIPYLEDFSAAVRRDDVDFVSICSEPERRLKLTLECIEAGKHLYLDKDPAPTVDAARQIADAASEKQLLSQAFSLIRVPAAAQAKATLESGDLGDLLGIHCDITFAKELVPSPAPPKLSTQARTRIATTTATSAAAITIAAATVTTICKTECNLGK